MAKHRRPPVIPEIAKAYQNDPQTQMALAALKSGTSTSPVATGKYGMADGIARVLQGVGGAYIDRKTQEGYRADEQEVLDERQKTGRDGLTGTAQAAQAAQALGVPAPALQPPAAPSLAPPVAAPAMTPQLTQGLPPSMGAGPGAARPFGPSAARPANTPAFMAPPEPEAVPDAPAPVARPVAPKAEGPTRSRMLDAAYRIMANANPYESARGQDMYTEGLADQTKMDESAAERRQRLSDMGYSSDLNAFTAGQSQDRAGVFDDRQATVEHNRSVIDQYNARTFQYGVHKEDQAFEAHQKSMDRANAMAVAMARARTSASGTTALTDEEQDAVNKAVGAKKLDPLRLTGRQLKTLAGALVANPGLDTVRLHAMAQLAANGPAQRQAMTVEILPDVLNNVRNAGKKLNYSNVQFGGKLQAFAKGQLNDPALTDYMTQRNDALLTVAQVMRGTGATDMSTKMEAEAARPTMSPQALDAWYNAQLTALIPRARIAEKRGLLEVGTTDALVAAHGSGAAPSAAAPGSGWGELRVR